jgi:hypothetical protein
MGDPVMAADGHSYDRAQIEGWFATGKRTSPMTNDEMEDQVLRPNRQLKSQIGDWRGKSNAQWVADIVAAIVMADDPKEVERKLDELTGFVAHNKAVVQPTTLQKLNGMLQCSQGLWVAPVRQSLRAVEAECKLVAAGFAARLQYEPRKHGLGDRGRAAAQKAQDPAATAVAQKRELASSGCLGALVARVERLEVEARLPATVASAALDAVADYATLPLALRCVTPDGIWAHALALNLANITDCAQQATTVETVQMMVELHETFEGDRTFVRQLRRKCHFGRLSEQLPPSQLQTVAATDCRASSSMQEHLPPPPPLPPREEQRPPPQVRPELRGPTSAAPTHAADTCIDAGAEPACRNEGFISKPGGWCTRGRWRLVKSLGAPLGALAICMGAVVLNDLQLFFV